MHPLAPEGSADGCVAIVLERVASESAAEGTARLTFWRFLGDLGSLSWLSRAKSRASASLYGTEGQRFESSRARAVAGFSAGLGVGVAPKVNRSTPRHLGPK
jgi:hypothetical protein